MALTIHSEISCVDRRRPSLSAHFHSFLSCPTIRFESRRPILPLYLHHHHLSLLLSPSDRLDYLLGLFLLIPHFFLWFHPPILSIDSAVNSVADDARLHLHKRRAIGPSTRPVTSRPLNEWTNVTLALVIFVLPRQSDGFGHNKHDASVAPLRTSR